MVSCGKKATALVYTFFCLSNLFSMQNTTTVIETDAKDESKQEALKHKKWVENIVTLIFDNKYCQAVRKMNGYLESVQNSEEIDRAKNVIVIALKKLPLHVITKKIKDSAECHGLTMLHYAAFKGQLFSLLVFVHVFPDINVRSDDKTYGSCTALHYALLSLSHLVYDMIDLLVLARADIHATIYSDGTVNDWSNGLMPLQLAKIIPLNVDNQAKKIVIDLLTPSKSFNALNTMVQE